MKKRLILILCIILLPIFVNAKDSCTVVSGTGDNIGDEIKCGTESFYITSNNGDTLSLLAKYNLFVGDKIDFIKVNINDYYASNLSDYDFCMQEAQEAGFDPYYVYPTEDANQNPGCRVYEKIKYDRVVQDERAVGTKLVNGRSILPLYGIVYMNPYWGYERAIDHEYYYNEYDENGDLDLSTTPFEKYLNGYKEELKNQNIDVKNVSFITLPRTIELLESISGEEIEVALEYPTYPFWDQDPESMEAFFGKMDIKELLGEKHAWVYDTTYWLGSGFYGDPNNGQEDGHNDYYISNEGMLCAIGRGDCQYFAYPIGNGIRPLVVIPKNEVKKPMPLPIRNPETGTTVVLIVISMIAIASLVLYISRINKIFN